MDAKTEDLLKWALNICNEIQSIKTYANRFPETASLGSAIENYQHRLAEEKLTKCTNCGEMVKMISTGEFCPKCMC